MSAISLDADLRDGLARFIADRDEPPHGRMSPGDAVNVIVRDWLMGQGYIPLPGDDAALTPARDAAHVPKG
tara:strand:+ start:670 stop:882 length:213 start_codon:yes stop_codon:yes gene_type:complete